MDGAKMLDGTSETRPAGTIDALTGDPSTVAGKEILSFIQRWESDEAAKKEYGVNQKETMAEAKSRGYSVTTIRQLIKLRAKDPNDAAEEQATLEMYKAAIAML
jgi:uncharacterized protein (UPF0335 family)